MGGKEALTREEKLAVLMTKAKAQRAASIDQLKRAIEFVDSKAKTATLPELDARLVVVEKAYKLFEDNQLEIESMDAQELAGDVRADFEETYLVIKPALQVFINQFRTNTEGVNNNNASEKFLVKLPKCEITPFAGDRKKWFTFYESFHKLIHCNPNISDIARFGYLKSLVVHPAAKTIESLELTSENYMEAITLLKNRYQNKKLICEDHIREIFSLKQIIKPTSENITHLLDTINSNLRALFSLQRPTPHWDDLIIHLICSKLDPDTRSKWDDEAPIDRMPTLDELTSFLNKRCHCLESQIAHNNKSNPINMHSPFTMPTHSRKSNFQRVSLAIQSNTICNFCKANNHLIYKCKKFIKLPIAERMAAINHLALCINCLRADHTLASCASRFICFKCKQQHHSLLHDDAAEISSYQDELSLASQTLQQGQPQPHQQHTQISNSFENVQPQSSTSASVTFLPSTHQSFEPNVLTNNSYVYLSTALVKVYDKNGVPIIGRALLDSASQAHIISDGFAEKLGLTQKQTSSSIRGINDKLTSSNFSVNLTIRSCLSEFSTSIEAQVLPTITSVQPAIAINTSNWQIPENIRLADPNFATPQTIDLLIGAELYLTLLSIGQIKLAANLPHLQNTQLGWIVSGKITNFSTSRIHSLVATTTNEPQFLTQTESYWQKILPQYTGENKTLEYKIQNSSMVTSYASSGFSEIYNKIKYKHNYRSLINVISYILRFVFNSKVIKENRSLLPELSLQERERGLLAIMKMIQREAFIEEYQKLKQGKQIHHRSRLKTSPFLVENDIIRVGGRLFHSTLSYGIKHPFFLSYSHSFTSLLLKHLHFKFLHAGPQALLAATRQQFWPLNGRNIAQKIVNQCFTCRRINNLSQLMLKAQRLSRWRRMLKHNKFKRCSSLRFSTFVMYHLSIYIYKNECLSVCR